MRTIWIRGEPPADSGMAARHRKAAAAPYLQDVAADRGFQTRALADGSLLAVSKAGDHTFLSADELSALEARRPELLPISKRAELQSKFFLPSLTGGAGTARLLRSRQVARRETILVGPSLHIIVPTLQCAHTCRYCQVSRSLSDIGHTMSVSDLNAACDAIFDSPAPTLTVEFQGGEPFFFARLGRRRPNLRMR